MIARLDAPGIDRRPGFSSDRSPGIQHPRPPPPRGSRFARSTSALWWRTHGPPLRASRNSPAAGRSGAAGPFGAAGLNRRSLEHVQPAHLLAVDQEVAVGEQQQQAVPATTVAAACFRVRLAGEPSPTGERTPPGFSPATGGPTATAAKPARSGPQTSPPSSPPAIARVGEDADPRRRRRRAGLARCRDRGGLLFMAGLRWGPMSPTRPTVWFHRNPGPEDTEILAVRQPPNGR